MQAFYSFLTTTVVCGRCSRLKFALKMTHPFEKRPLRQIAAYNVSTGFNICAPWGPTSYMSPFSRCFESKILTLTLIPQESSKVKFDGAKLGIGLQQAPLRLVRHPAKFQPDRANGLRDVRYQFFHFLTLGANIWAKVHQKGRRPATHPGLPSRQISSPCVNPRQRYPLQKSCGQTKLQTVNVTNRKRYTPSMPIGMWE